MGGSAFDLQLNQGVDLGTALADEGTESVLFETLRDYPLSSVTVVLAIFLIAIFFITGADSRLDRDGHAQPARRGGAEAVAGRSSGALRRAPCRRCCCGPAATTSAGLTALQNLVIIVGGAVHAGDHRDVRLADEVAPGRALRVDPGPARAPGGAVRPAARPARSSTRSRWPRSAPTTRFVPDAEERGSQPTGWLGPHRGKAEPRRRPCAAQRRPRGAACPGATAGDAFQRLAHHTAVGASRRSTAAVVAGGHQPDQNEDLRSACWPG